MGRGWSVVTDQARCRARCQLKPACVLVVKEAGKKFSAGRENRWMSGHYAGQIELLHWMNFPAEFKDSDYRFFLSAGTSDC